MSGHVEAAEAVQGIQSTNQSVTLGEVADRSASEAERVNLMSSNFEDAVDLAVSSPIGTAHTTSVKESITGSGAGEVGEAKLDIMSDIPRDGVNTPDSSDDAATDNLIERFNTLYSEMTNWQVAWSVAQRTQTDTNQLLRGQ